MVINNFLVGGNHGRKSRLDKLYYEHVSNLLQDIDEYEEIKWDTYGLIIESFINQGFNNVFKEVKYRMTDGENINKIILDLIDRYSDSVDGVVWHLKKRVENYLEEDYYKEFF